MPEKFCLPDEYISNSIATTRDEIRETGYWNARRLNAAWYYQYPVYKYCATLIRRHAIETVVDVGCGVAPKLVSIKKRFPRINIVGIDQRAPIEYCKKTYNVGNWYVDDVEDPAGSSLGETADLVICSDVIEHVINPDALLEYLRTRCKTDGLIVVSTPDRARLHGPRNLRPRNPDHVREWSYDEFAQYIKSRGFHVINHFHLGPVKIGANRPTLMEALRCIKNRTKFRYNQVCVFRV